MAQPSLLDILSNNLLLLSTTPYLLPTELLSLSLASRSFFYLVTRTRAVYRHLNLSLAPVGSRPSSRFSPPVPTYQYDPTRLLETPHVLRDVQTLILDGLAVPIETLHALLATDIYRIQLLSLRGNSLINDRQFTILLQHLVRPSRPPGTPTLKGLYWFGEMDEPGGLVPSSKWAPLPTDAAGGGRFVKAAKMTEVWAGIVKASEGIIAFDTRLCTGPRHHATAGGDVEPKIAGIRLKKGCAQCGTFPEKRYGGVLQPVLVAPVPLHTSSVAAACRGKEVEEDTLRCESCCSDRWCDSCGKWWCEDCFDSEKKPVALDCFECGAICGDCSKKTTKICQSCTGGYCIVHNEGADLIRCEWCNSSGLRTREFTYTLTTTSQLHHRPHNHHHNQQLHHPRKLQHHGQQQQGASPRFTPSSFRTIAASHFQDEVISRRRCLMTN